MTLVQNIKQLGLILGLVLCMAPLRAQMPYSLELQTLINDEQSRLSRMFFDSSFEFMTKIDRLQDLCGSRNFTEAQKVRYLTSLYNYLSSIKSATGNDDFKSGRYERVLDFFPIYVKQCQQGNPRQYLRENLTRAIEAYPMFMQEPYAQEIIQLGLEKHPDFIIRNGDMIMEIQQGHAIVVKASRRDPNTAKRYIHKDSPLNDLLRGAKDQTIRATCELYDKFGLNSKAYPLVYHMVRGNMNAKELNFKCQDEKQRMRMMVDLSYKTDLVGAFSLYRELEFQAARYAWELNNSRIANLKQRFKSIDFLNADELFVVAVYGAKEFNTETMRALLKFIASKQTKKFNKEYYTTIHKPRLDYFYEQCRQRGLVNELGSLNERLTPIQGAKQGYVLPTSPFFFAQQLHPVATIEPPRIEHVPIRLSHTEREINALKRNPIKALNELETFIDASYAEIFLRFAALNYPQEVLKKYSVYQHKYYAASILETIAQQAPLVVKRYLGSAQHPITQLLRRSDDPMVQALFEIHEELGNTTRAYMLMDAIHKGSMSAKAADRLIKDRESELFATMSRIAAQGRYIGAYTVDAEMTNFALNYVRLINDAEPNGRAAQERLVHGMSAEEIYFLIIFGKEEVLHQSFHILYPRLISAKGNGFQLLQSVGFNRFRTFIKLCAEFGTLDRFMATMSNEQQGVLLDRMVKNLETYKDQLSEVVHFADALGSVKDAVLLQQFSQRLNAELTRVKSQKNPTGIAIYGILAVILAEKIDLDQAQLAGIADQFPSIDQVYFDELLKQDIIYQQALFFDDHDGHVSFDHFLRFYRRSPALWDIQLYEKYVRITSKQGRKVVVMANRPRHEYQGTSAVIAQFEQLGVTPSIVVHRGHSVHTDKTLRRLASDAKIIFLGSCGGYHRIADAMEIAPHAHVIATKQIGTMHINDPIQLLMNNYLRDGRDIIWSEFWDEIEGKVGHNPLFKDYVPPHKNIGALFIQAYYQILGV